jgi:hypothetical protein
MKTSQIALAAAAFAKGSNTIGSKFFLATREFFSIAIVIAIISIGMTVYASPNKDSSISSLKSVSVSNLKTRIKDSNSISYEKIYDVGQRVEDQKSPVDWNRYFAENRSANFYLHSWDMLNNKLIDYDDSRSRSSLETALVIAKDWVKHNHASYVNNQTTNFAWYDMAVGIRAYRLSYILDQAIRADIGTDADYKLLWDSVVDHAVYLNNDSNIIFHNNHGVYQAAGQKAMARRFSMVSQEVFANISRQADMRLARMIKQQFTAEGVHKEHSPDYHRMVYTTYEALAAEGLLDDDTDSVLTKAGDAMFWMIKPDGVLANFGDSDYRTIPRDAEAYASPSEHLMYYLSSGTQGTRPTSPLKAYKDSGLAVVKTNNNYLAQQAAFFSRTHKHADDLTFLWYEGQDILIGLIRKICGLI